MTRLKKTNVLLGTVISLGCVLQGAIGHSPVEAAFQVPEVLTVEEHPSQDVLGEKNTSNVSDGNGGERNFLGERLFQRNPERKRPSMK